MHQGTIEQRQNTLTHISKTIRDTIPFFQGRGVNIDYIAIANYDIKSKKFFHVSSVRDWSIDCYDMDIVNKITKGHFVKTKFNLTSANRWDDIAQPYWRKTPNIDANNPDIIKFIKTKSGYLGLALRGKVGAEQGRILDGFIREVNGVINKKYSPAARDLVSRNINSDAYNTILKAYDQDIENNPSLLSCCIDNVYIDGEHLKIVSELAAGKSTVDIALVRMVSRATIGGIIFKLQKRLGVSTQAALVALLTKNSVI